MSSPRSADGSAGDADYTEIGAEYARYRRPDPRIGATVLDALDGARTVVNVGAGAGSYEPFFARVTAVEPSATMRAQRSSGLPDAVDAVAENLPFADDTFEAALATFTVHQWHDLRAGLAELRRVTIGPVVVLTCDPVALARFWLARYAPEVIATEARRYPDPARIADALGGTVRIDAVPIPLDCTDGFGEAYYGRPEALLDVAARRANSAWSLVDPGVHARFERHLRHDLESGEWDAEYGGLREQPVFDGSLRLVVGWP